jgi:hypothetical protein
MYKDSIQARREIARNFTELNYLTLCTGRRCAWALIAISRPKNCVRTSLFLHGVRSFRS